MSVNQMLSLDISELSINKNFMQTFSPFPDMLGMEKIQLK